MHKKIPVFLASIMLVAFANIAYADLPTIASFTVAPSSISNDYDISLSWTVSNGDGLDLYFNCPEGVTLKTSGGSSYACNTRQAAGSGATDSLALRVINVSGTTKTVTASAYPKSGSTANDAGVMTQSFAVATAYQPITDVTASKSVVESGAPVTITWTGVYAPATNMQIDCANGLTIYAGSSASGTALPCGGPAFSSDQSLSGSTVLTFVNATAIQIGATVHVMPAIHAGLYDATHNLTTTVAVNPQVVQSNVVVRPMITSLLAGSSVTNNIPFTLGWVSQNASSTNLQYACNDNLTLYSVGSATTTLPCNSPAFATPLSGAGSTTLVVLNRGFVPQTLTVTMMPQDGNGIYLLAGARTLNLPVQFATQPVAVSPTAAVTTAATPASATAKGLSHVPFFRNMSRGSKSPDVVALQLFLGLNTDIYPEGTATGFFGPATQKAVQRFQEKYGIAKAGEQGYGSVGPKTRAKLNAVTSP